MSSRDAEIGDDNEESDETIEDEKHENASNTRCWKCA